MKIKSLLFILITTVSLTICACSATVDSPDNNNDNTVIQITELSLSTDSVSLVVGNKTTVTATIKPDNATDKTITWTSRDTNIATVKDGVITAIAKGETSIEVSAGTIKKSISVKVSEAEIKIKDFELPCTSLLIGIGQTETISVKLVPENATPKTIEWSSNNINIATVDNGTITGISVGNTIIKAKYKNIEKTINVEVKESVIPVSSITLSVTELFLNKNQTATLVASVLPENATDKSIVWKTSDSSIVSVNNGVITTLNYGVATITASSGSKSATATIHVCIPVENITLSSENITLQVGQTTTLSANVTPTNATDKTISWTSSNEAVATVNNGKVTALMGGVTTITATAGGVSNTCLVTVNVPVSNIALSETSITLAVGASYKIKSTIAPANATNKNTTWTSSNELIATVDNGVITGVAPGTTTIYCYADNKTASVSVNIVANSGSIEVTNLTLSTYNVQIKVGETATVIPTVNPTNAENSNVTWSSNNSNIATVNYGTITGIAPGSTTITATAGSITKSVTVNVQSNIIPVTQVLITPNIHSLVVGNTQTLTATVLPNIATDKSITWSSSDNTIATVNGYGLVTAKKTGLVTITATSKSGVKAVAEIIVTNPGVTINIPSDAIYTDDEFLDLKYTKNGSIYTFTATSKIECAYIAFYVNGEQKINVKTTKMEQYSIDIKDLNTRYLNVFAFGFYDKDHDNYSNDLITSKNQISIDLLEE